MYSCRTFEKEFTPSAKKIFICTRTGPPGFVQFSYTCCVPSRDVTQESGNNAESLTPVDEYVSMYRKILCVGEPGGRRALACLVMLTSVHW